MIILFFSLLRTTVVVSALLDFSYGLIGGDMIYVA